MHRDRQTGEEIVAGLTQVHVEVIVDRMKERFGAEVTLKPPRVPYHETIRGPAKAHGRYKKQTGGRGQFGDCHIEIEPMPVGQGFEFVNKIKGGVIPSGFIPAVEKGIVETMPHGVIAGYPVEGVRVTLYDGSYHSVDSSEMAFKVAGSLAFKEAMEKAKPVLLEPIMTVAVTVPEDCVGDVIGDLNSRRGRPLGMEPKGRRPRCRPEVPMAEMLSYAPDLRQITGGRAITDGAGALRGGAPHLAGKVVEKAQERGRSGPRLASIAAVKKELRPFHDHVTCDVCGRTILKGERTEAYLAPGRRAPCRVRAVLRARRARGLDPRVRARTTCRRAGRARQERRPLLGRLRRREARRAARRSAGDRAGRGASRAPGRGSRPAPPRAPARAPAGPAPRARRAHHGRGEGGARARAVQLVPPPAHGGGARPQPGAAVRHRRAGPDAPSTVTVLVAWELSWYRYRVDLGDAAEPVALQGKGDELDDIDEPLRDWNAGSTPKGDW